MLNNFKKLRRGHYTWQLLDEGRRGCQGQDCGSHVDLYLLGLLRRNNEPGKEGHKLDAQQASGQLPDPIHQRGKLIRQTPC